MPQDSKIRNHHLEIKSIDLKNFYEWPFPARVLVYFLVGVVVVYLGYFFDFSNQGDQIYQRFKQEQDLKQQMQSIIKNEEKMEEEVSHLPEIQKTLGQWQGQLISGDNLPDLLNQVLKIGANNHIQFSIFTPDTKKKQDVYYMVPIKVVMQGSYDQLASFMSQVANMPQLVVLSNFIILRQNSAAPGSKALPLPTTISTSEEMPAEIVTPNANLLTCQLLLEVYYLAKK